jgi:hypothetical protein
VPDARHGLDRIIVRENTEGFYAVSMGTAWAFKVGQDRVIVLSHKF